MNGATPYDGNRPIRSLPLGGANGRVELWDLGDYDDPGDDEPLAQLPPIVPDLRDPGKTGGSISRVVFNPAGQGMLAFATGNVSSVQSNDRGGAWVWIAPESAGGEARQFPLGTNSDGPVADIAFSPKGDLIAVAGFKKLPEMTLGRKPDAQKDGVWDGTVQIFETATGKPLHDEPFTVKGPAQSVAFDRRGERLVVASGDRNGANPNLPGRVVVFNVKHSQRTTPVVMEECESPSIRAVVQPGRQGRGFGG